ncbi:ABC transporter substrate-binding protein [Sedimentibacter sp.]|uniref:ABC transporter substrate-binding protein n=1 Tax=Sedimentibacter sp. TaxID=1960295 RepID=UPI0028AFC055|nr:ABC transporter substrate-binding protein [Sedimentibacter sp.]
MKKISLLLMLITVLLAAGCNKQEPVNTEHVNVTIAGLKGPTSIGMIKMIDEKVLNTDKYNVSYVTESAPDALTGKIINGEIQISSVPINLAPVLYNKTGGKVQLMAVNTIGNLYIVGTDDIESIGELEGKMLGMSAKGSTPDFAMNYLLNQNNISDKVELNYAMDHATMSQSVITEDTKVALLPQPFVTQTMIKNSNVKILVDLNEAWKAATDNTSQLYTGAVIVNKDFAENNKDFVEEFLKQYEASVNWVLENQKDASLLVEKNEIMPSAAVVEKAIPYCGIVYEPAHNVKDGLNEFYKILFDSNPASVGGKLPDEGFYFTK